MLTFRTTGLPPTAGQSPDPPHMAPTCHRPSSAATYIRERAWEKSNSRLANAHDESIVERRGRSRAPAILSAAHRLQFRQWSSGGKDDFSSLIAGAINLSSLLVHSSRSTGILAAAVAFLLEKPGEGRSPGVENRKHALREQHAWTTALKVSYRLT